MSTWLDSDGCGNCDHCGMDMDMDMDPYCVHPEVLKTKPYGLYTRSARPDICKGELWAPRTPRSLPVVQAQ